MRWGQEERLPGSRPPRGQLQAIPVQFGHGTPLVCVRLLLSLTAEGTQMNLTILRKAGRGLPPIGTWLSAEPSLQVGAKVTSPSR